MDEGTARSITILGVIVIVIFVVVSQAFPSLNLALSFTGIFSGIILLLFGLNKIADYAIKPAEGGIQVSYQPPPQQYITPYSQVPQVKYCPRCGAINRYDAQFCPYCDYKFSS
ncbi:hypothetical protein HS7_02710 [Sulfolobales archaeon HS-7]|nr:hypothetical protein HS7_02710 [Sulfolobales archaeon HS-7]